MRTANIFLRSHFYCLILFCLSAVLVKIAYSESHSGQRERKSVWQGFQYKSKICEFVSVKLSKCLYLHS